MKNYLPQLEAEQIRLLNRDYLGEGNRRGNSAMGLAGQIGAATGAGPKATIAAQQGVSSDLMNKIAATRALTTKIKADWMGTGQWKAAQGLQNQPRNPASVSSGFNIQPTAGSPGIIQGMAEAWAGGGFQGADDMWGGIKNIFSSSGKGTRQDGGGPGGGLSYGGGSFGGSINNMPEPGAFNETLSNNNDYGQYSIYNMPEPGSY